MAHHSCAHHRLVIATIGPGRYGTGVGSKSLLGVLPGVARALGLIVPDGVTVPDGATVHDGAMVPDEVTAPDVEAPKFPNAQRALIVLCDVLGWHNLDSRKAHAPYLRRQMPQMQKLTTTFPSTTAAAIPSFGTGKAPGQTGFVGYTVRNPDDGALVNLVPWTHNLDPTIVATPVGNSQAPKFSIPPTRYQPSKTVFQLLIEAGVPVTNVGSAKFAGSGLSTAAFGKTGYAVAETPKDRIDAVLRQLRKFADKQLVYLYWGDLDKIGHQFGPDSNEWADALTDFDAAFQRLVTEAPRGTLIVLTADHGQITPDPAQQIDVATTPALAEGVALVAGEARAVHVYLTTAPGFRLRAIDRATAQPPEIEAAAARWRNYLGDKAQMWTRAEALQAKIFGPVRPEVEPWIGDLVVAPTGVVTIVDSRTQTANSLTLKGVHGSLTPTEMEIPLLAIVT